MPSSSDSSSSSLGGVANVAKGYLHALSRLKSPGGGNAPASVFAVGRAVSSPGKSAAKPPSQAVNRSSDISEEKPSSFDQLLTAAGLNSDFGGIDSDEAASSPSGDHTSASSTSTSSEKNNHVRAHDSASDSTPSSSGSGSSSGGSRYQDSAKSTTDSDSRLGDDSAYQSSPEITPVSRNPNDSDSPDDSNHSRGWSTGSGRSSSRTSHQSRRTGSPSMSIRTGSPESHPESQQSSTSYLYTGAAPAPGVESESSHEEADEPTKGSSGSALLSNSGNFDESASPHQGNHCRATKDHDSDSTSSSDNGTSSSSGSRNKEYSESNRNSNSSRSRSRLGENLTHQPSREVNPNSPTYQSPNSSSSYVYRGASPSSGAERESSMSCGSPHSVKHEESDESRNSSYGSAKSKQSGDLRGETSGTSPTCADEAVSTEQSQFPHYSSQRSDENEESHESRESSYCSAKSKESGEPKRKTPNISPTRAQEAVASVNGSTQRSLLPSCRIPAEGLDENFQSHAYAHVDSKEHEGHKTIECTSSSAPPHADFENISPARPNPQQMEAILPQSASRPTSVLQRLEARRKALQASSLGGGSRVIDSRSAMSSIEDEQQSQSKGPVQDSTKGSLDIRLVGLDKSQDEDTSILHYDPRSDERDEWKVLIERSGIGKTHSGDDTMWDAKDGKGWMPPALTTYGENKYSPNDENLHQQKSDPPSSTLQDSGLIRQVKRPARSTTPKAVPSIPIQEIEIAPLAEDESSLGSMGHLFPTSVQSSRNPEPIDPMKSVEPSSLASRREPELVTHRMKPTVAGTDYAYYRSWIRPGVLPPSIPNTTVLMELCIPDPPADSKEFNPTMTVRTAYTPPDLQDMDAGVEEARPFKPDSVAHIPSDCWTPFRPIRDLDAEQPSDEWERWKLARVNDRDGMSDSSTKRSTRSFASSLSDWAPPGKLPKSGQTPRSKDNHNKSLPPSSSWIPPTRLSRIDFAGDITSQKSPMQNPRKAHKDPIVVPFSNSSFQQPSDSMQTKVVPPKEIILGSENQKIGPAQSQKGEMEPSRSSSKFSSGSSSEDTDAIFATQTNQPATIAPTPVSQSRKPDVEARRADDPKEMGRRYRQPAFCICCMLGFLAVAGGATAAVLLLGDFLPSSNRSSSPTATTVVATFPPSLPPDVAPVASSPVAAPMLPPTLSPSLLLPSTPSKSPSVVVENEDLSDDPLYELITTRYPAGATTLADSDSPQRMAFDWVRSSVNSHIKSTLELLQRYALATLFYSTNGVGWASSTAWLSSDSECSWSTTAASGSMCNSDGILVELSLQNNNLNGELPGEIILLWNSLGKCKDVLDSLFRVVQ